MKREPRRWWPWSYTTPKGESVWLIEGEGRYVARVKFPAPYTYSLHTTKYEQRALRTNFDAALAIAVLMQEREER